MTADKFSLIGDQQRQRPHRLDMYLAAERELEQLRDRWITLTKHAPNNRHTRAARERIKRRAAELKAFIASVEQPAPPR